MYQKEFYLPLEGNINKLMAMLYEEWTLLNIKALGMVRLCLGAMVTFNIRVEKILWTH